MAPPRTTAAYPSSAHLLALVGGIFVLLGGVISLALGSVGTSFLAAEGLGGLGPVELAVGAVGVVVGALVLYGAAQLRSHPERARTWGILLLVLSFVSWIGSAGLIIGFLLTLIGGLLALRWKPPTLGSGPAYVPSVPPGTPVWGTPLPPTPPATPAAPGSKFCSFCGAPNIATARFCAKCGARLP